MGQCKCDSTLSSCFIIHELFFQTYASNVQYKFKSEEWGNLTILNTQAIGYVFKKTRIAFKGTQEEYIIAKTFFDDFIKKLKEYTKKEVSIVFVPGNHDCKIKKEDPIREILIGNVLKNKKCEDDVLDSIANVQESYFEFSCNYHKNYNIVYENKLNTTIEFQLNNNKIQFSLLNTAWISNRSKNELFMPINQLNINDTEIFNIAIFHHNFSWLEANNAREYKNIIEKNHDLILTGHEHTSTFEKRVNDKNSIEQFEGGVLQDSKEDHNSSFNFILINLDEKQIKLSKFNWENHIYKEIEESDWIDCFQKKTSFKHNLSKKFNNWLCDAGADYSHPRKRGEIVLSDIYIHPELEKLTKEKDEDLKLDYKDSKFLFNDKEILKKKFLIVGDEKSGKTSLIKMLYKNHHFNGYVPIYILGEKIKSYDFSTFLKLLKKEYIDQYSRETLEHFMQLDKNKKIIFIDDFDKSNLNTENKKIFLKIIAENFENIFLIGSDFFHLEGVLTKGSEEINKKYIKYKIEEFGHKLTYLLIDKWNTLGEENNFSKDDLSRKNDEAKKMIDFSINKKIVPSYPIFILTSLQTMEAGHSFDVGNSTRGYYYQYLITESIGKISSDHDEVDSHFNFLAELSFKIFNTKNMSLNYCELYTFHENFKKKYRVSPYFKKMANFENLKINLEKANILIDNNDRLEFKYKYIYYYFISKYFSENLEKDNIKDIVQQLIYSVYKEESANIIMFLTHHTKNNFIIDTLIKNAKNIFKDNSVVKFEDDISEINNLVEQINLKYEVSESSKETEKNKLNIYEKKDNLTRIKPPHEEIETEEDLSFASDLNLAFKTIDIIGNILKSYHTSLEGSIRLNLAEEAHLLGLRTMGLFFDILNNDIEIIQKKIEELIEKEKTKITSNFEKEKIARSFIFSFSSAISFFFIEKISTALSYNKLSETYKDFLEKHNYNTCKLTNLTMELEFQKELPINLIEDLMNDFQKNKLSEHLMKNIIIKHLYLVPVKYDEKQKICSLLNISSETQKKIAYKS